MKNILSKLNVQGIKNLFLKHGEKVGLGCAGLIVLVCLAMTDWSGESQSPVQLTDQATKSKNDLLASPWPDSQKKEFADVSLSMMVADKVVRGLDVAQFEYRVPMSPKVYPKTKAIQDPPFLAVEDPIASFGEFVMATIPPVEELPAEEGDPADGAAPATPPRGPRSPMPASPLSPMPMPMPGGASPRSPNAAGPGMHTPPGAMPAGPTPGMPVGMGMGMEGMMAGGTARGVRYVAVRGVVPYRTQLEKLARALNLETTAEALNYLQYQDFEIERQKAVAGGAPWSGEWEKLDVQVAVDLVNQAASWDADVVATEVTDSIFTMPLPARLNGFWTDDVSHPRLEQWRLNEEQRQTELEKNEALLEQAGDGVGGKKGGFGKVQRDLGGMSRGGMMPGMPGMPGMSPAMPGMPAMPGNPAMPGPGMRPGSAMHAGPGMRPGSMPSAMPSAMPPGMMPGGHRPGPGGMPASRMPGNPAMPGMGPAMPGMGNMGMAATAQTRIVPMLLFRFLDTVVEPGAAYRYRVRLIAANPNVGLPPEQVENPAVAEGETRNTEWSVPTPPVVIPFDTQYFVAKVPRSAGKPQAGAEMVVFQWNSDTGTLVSHTFKDAVGKPIGGKTKSSLLDLTKGFIEKDAEVTIRTPDVLLDSVGLGGVTAVALPGAPSSTLKRTMDDLAIDKATWTRMIDSGALDLAVTVNPAGEILVNDGISTASAKVAAEKKVEAEREPYKDIEPAGEGPSGLDAIMMQQMMMNGGPAGGHGTDKKAAKGKKGNPLRIGGPSAMMMGPGMMPPGMGPAGMSPMPGSMSPAMMDAMKKSKKK